jgi:hypothetical protein
VHAAFCFIFAIIYFPQRQSRFWTSTLIMNKNNCLMKNA